MEWNEIEKCLFLLLIKMEWNEIEKLIHPKDFDVLESTTQFSAYTLSERTRKSFYYASGKNPFDHTLSYSLTKEAVETFRRYVPRNNGKIGPYYASKLVRNTCVSPCSLLMALIYVDRLYKSNPNYLTTVTSSELFLVSMLIASKFLFDEGTEEGTYNDEWAASGCLSNKKVKALERQFLIAINYDAFVTRDQFDKVIQYMEYKIALKNGLSRGNFTYTDLYSLLQSNSFCEKVKSMFHLFVQTVVALTAVYLTTLTVCLTAYMVTTTSFCQNDTISSSTSLPVVKLPIFVDDLMLKNPIVMEDLEVVDITVNKNTTNSETTLENPQLKKLNYSNEIKSPKPTKIIPTLSELRISENDVLNSQVSSFLDIPWEDKKATKNKNLVYPNVIPHKNNQNTKNSIVADKKSIVKSQANDCPCCVCNISEKSSVSACTFYSSYFYTNTSLDEIVKDSLDSKNFMFAFNEIKIT